MLYAFFDGDNIGPTVEILLTENRIAEAVEFSENIKSAMLEIENLLVLTDGINTLIIGGDDIVIQFDPSKQNIDFLENIRTIFEHRTGNSMSCGVGSSIQESIWNLHIAKLYGKNTIRGVE